jgi:chemotaxis response regulator CheB
MPKAAAEMAAASEILPLEKIGPRLVSLARHKRRVYA